jgi:methylmalonyl-CoA mutase cobalamin-binding subunit
LAAVTTKYYRALGTNTGSAINQTVDKIMAANFDKGLNKIMIVLTDGYSYDDVLYASNYARSKGITMIAVGIGANYDYDQLL